MSISDLLHLVLSFEIMSFDSSLSHSQHKNRPWGRFFDLNIGIIKSGEKYDNEVSLGYTVSLKSFLKNNVVRTVLAFSLVVIFFSISTWLAQKYENELLILAARDGLLGMSVYIGLTIIATVLAPISTLPLIPLAVGMWGWFITGVLSIIGWTVGSLIAFFLARRYGKALIQKFVSLDHLADIEKRFGGKGLFWTVVLLRMTIPVDLLSYALGLFSNMKTVEYFLATVIGITPFAFVFSYLGSLPPVFQVIGLIEIFLLIAVIYYIWGRKTGN